MSESEIILGIESSCDETSAAVLTDGQLRSNIISSQHIHHIHGGVVPELASRAHQARVIPVVRAALEEAGVEKSDLTAIAVTRGPGLVGALLVGVQVAKGMSLGLNIPLIGVHHVEAHVHAAFLEQPPPELPFVCLTVSGGHTQLVLMRADLSCAVLGTTRDDAAGEAYDKVGKLLGLGYPGGPEVDRLAAVGDPTTVRFPRPMLPDAPFDFSFSGLKTAVLHHLRRQPDPEAYLAVHRADVCASFQASVVEVLVRKLIRAAEAHGVGQIVLAGGVASNRGLRTALNQAAAQAGLRLTIPRPEFCTDNAAMIAMSGRLKRSAGQRDGLDLEAVPSWPLPRLGALA